jgi:hypothetical protein
MRCSGPLASNTSSHGPPVRASPPIQRRSPARSVPPRIPACSAVTSQPTVFDRCHWPMPLLHAAFGTVWPLPHTGLACACHHLGTPLATAATWPMLPGRQDARDKTNHPHIASPCCHPLRAHPDVRVTFPLAIEVMTAPSHVPVTDQAHSDHPVWACL